MRLPTIFDSLKVFKRYYPERIATVIDGGVQVGTDFLMSEFKEAKHFLFEPVLQYHNSIRENYKRAGISYELLDYAVSNESGKMYLHLISGDHSGKITHSQLLPERSPQKFGEKLIDIVEIRVITLDELARETYLEKPYIVKIDVDGIEEKIIERGQNVLRNASLVITEDGLSNPVTRAKMIENIGFRLFDICNRCYYFDQLSQVDHVLINQEIVKNCIEFRPWEKTGYKVIWDKWDRLTKRPQST
ncbi:MAG: FkbM family methyltransferase [Candidatus Aenigmatarchaeota archaeon]